MIQVSPGLEAEKAVPLPSSKHTIKKHRQNDMEEKTQTTAPTSSSSPCSSSRSSLIQSEVNDCVPKCEPQVDCHEFETLSALSALRATAMVISSTPDHTEFVESLEQIIREISNAEKEIILSSLDDSPRESKISKSLLSSLDQLLDICKLAQVESLLPLLDPFVSVVKSREETSP